LDFQSPFNQNGDLEKKSHSMQAEPFSKPSYLEFAMSNTTTPLLEADTWKLTYHGSSEDFDPTAISFLTGDQSDSVSFFDSVELEVVWADSGSDEIEEYEDDEGRFWRLPDCDDSCTAADLRAFLNGRSDAPDEVKAAARSKHAFRAFKKKASPELLAAWEAHEDQQKVRVLLDFFRSHKVKVEQPTNLKLVK
jgi:hypothetical protein